jgi:hypothetical protein
MKNRFKIMASLVLLSLAGLLCQSAQASNESIPPFDLDASAGNSKIVPYGELHPDGTLRVIEVSLFVWDLDYSVSHSKISQAPQYTTCGCAAALQFPCPILPLGPEAFPGAGEGLVHKLLAPDHCAVREISHSAP